MMKITWNTGHPIRLMSSSWQSQMTEPKEKCFCSYYQWQKSIQLHVPANDLVFVIEFKYAMVCLTTPLIRLVARNIQWVCVRTVHDQSATKVWSHCSSGSTNLLKICICMFVHYISLSSIVGSSFVPQPVTYTVPYCYRLSSPNIAVCFLHCLTPSSFIHAE